MRYRLDEGARGIVEPTQSDESSRGQAVNSDPLVTRLSLTALGEDTFAGRPPRGFEQRLFGGHLLAQALMAAARTVAASRVANSLHAYFLRPGRPDGQIRYAVSRVRDGRSFATRSVRVEQDGHTLLVFDASFVVSRQPSDVRCAPMPPVPEPDSLAPLHERGPDTGHPPDGIRWRTRRDWWTGSRPLDVRYVDDDPLTGEVPGPRCFWFRAAPADDADQNVQRAILAFASDRSLLPAIDRARGTLGAPGRRRTASVDHAMWFHADVHAGEWLLYVQDSPVSSSGLGLARGLIYQRDGTVVASVTQQGLHAPADHHATLRSPEEPAPEEPAGTDRPGESPSR